MKYTTNYPSGTVSIGGLLLGGNAPIRVQSMTNTDTNDVVSSVRQCCDLADAGCEMVRLTTQGLREVKSLHHIKKTLRDAGYKTPLIADVHFSARTALHAAEVADKVRINPGNYTGGGREKGVPFDRGPEIIADNLMPLLHACRQQGVALRIGVNHGSLSSRMMERYGDTPAGMVESALEFAKICWAEGFMSCVFSMKSSNVKVMTEANRMLAHELAALGMYYPIHLGVTEAGAGEDGIIKSAVGIGTLLQAGIGDTIRVSLTGNPLDEIPVARHIAQRYQDGSARKIGNASPEYPDSQKSGTSIYLRTGAGQPPAVIQGEHGHAEIVDESGEVVHQITDADWAHFETIEAQMPVISSNQENKPIILKAHYNAGNAQTLSVDAAIDLGSLLLAGIGNAIWLHAPHFPAKWAHSTAFAILQATRLRITRTDYIACPSCGRTQFDIAASLELVKARTAHFKNLRIAVMGCIVNGPGEMADADYGYVGAGGGKVNIYKGKHLVKANIPEGEAIDQLLEIIGQDANNPDC